MSGSGSSGGGGGGRGVLRGVWGLVVAGGRQLSVVYLFVAIVVLFGSLEGSAFLSHVTLNIVLGQQVVVGVLALAVMIPLITGVFDLSVGAMLGFSLVIVNLLAAHHVMSAGPAAVVAVLACLGCGAINGLIVVKLRVNSFIATLGTSQVLAALALWLSKNSDIAGALPASFEKFGQSNVLGLPLPFFYLMGLAVAVWVLLEHTVLGRRLFAVGGNEDAARLAGIPTERLAWGSLIASGGLAGVAGVIFAAQVGVFDNSFGQPELFPAFAAVFLGATQIKGRPNVWGAMLAVYVLAFGVQGISLKAESAGYWVTPLFNGVALIIAVAFASRRLKFRIVADEQAPLDPPVVPEAGDVRSDQYSTS
jgi:ribose transport system permease protein